MKMEITDGLGDEPLRLIHMNLVGRGEQHVLGMGGAARGTRVAGIGLAGFAVAGATRAGADSPAS